MCRRACVANIPDADKGRATALNWFLVSVQLRHLETGQIKAGIENRTQHSSGRLLVLVVRLGRRRVHGQVVEEHDHQEQHHAQNVREHG